MLTVKYTHTYVHMNAHSSSCNVDKTLQLVHQKLREGAVYQVVPFNGKLVASVNNVVEIFSWSEESGELMEECSYSNNILALFVKTKGDFILVHLL